MVSDLEADSFQFKLAFYTHNILCNKLNHLQLLHKLHSLKNFPFFSLSANTFIIQIIKLLYGGFDKLNHREFKQNLWTVFTNNGFDKLKPPRSSMVSELEADSFQI